MQFVCNNAETGGRAAPPPPCLCLPFEPRRGPGRSPGSSLEARRRASRALLLRDSSGAFAAAKAGALPWSPAEPVCRAAGGRVGPLFGALVAAAVYEIGLRPDYDSEIRHRGPGIGLFPGMAGAVPPLKDAAPGPPASCARAVPCFLLRAPSGDGVPAPRAPRALCSCQTCSCRGANAEARRQQAWRARRRRARRATCCRRGQTRPPTTCTCATRCCCVSGRQPTYSACRTGRARRA